MRRLHNSNLTLMRRVVMAGAVAATLAGVGAAPALADDWGHRGDDHRGHWGRDHDDWRGHGWRGHEWREHHGYGWGAPRYYYSEPRYYYAPGYAYVPPPVVYPPPAYVAPGFNLGFYFH